MNKEIEWLIKELDNAKTFSEVNLLWRWYINLNICSCEFETKHNEKWEQLWEQKKKQGK